MLYNLKKKKFDFKYYYYFNFFFIYSNANILFINFLNFFFKKIYVKSNILFSQQHFGFFFLKRFINYFMVSGNFNKMHKFIYGAFNLFLNCFDLFKFLKYYCWFFYLWYFYLFTGFSFLFDIASIDFSYFFFNNAENLFFINKQNFYFFKYDNNFFLLNNFFKVNNLRQNEIIYKKFYFYYRYLSVVIKYSRLDRRVWKQNRRRGLRRVARLSILSKFDRFRFFLMWFKRDVLSNGFETIITRILISLNKFLCELNKTTLYFILQQSNKMFLNNFLSGKKLIS